MSAPSTCSYFDKNLEQRLYREIVRIRVLCFFKYQDSSNENIQLQDWLKKHDFLDESGLKVFVEGFFKKAAAALGVANRQLPGAVLLQGPRATTQAN